MRWSRRGRRAPPLFRIRPEGEKMRRIIDMEIEAPLSEAALRAQEIGKGRPGTPTGEPLDRPEGYGFANYGRSEEHTSELQSLMRISYAVFCLKKKKTRPNKETIKNKTYNHNNQQIE